MNTTNANHIFRLIPYYKGFLAVFVGLLLVACDTVPTETSPNLGNTSRVLGYTGPSCGVGISDPVAQADACTFKVEFWNKMSDSQCTNCHDSQSSATQSPFFMESSDVNVAYAQALTIVDLPALRPATLDPTAPQAIVDKIAGGHNCGNVGACAALASNVLTYVTNWANGGTGGSGGTTNVIVLTPPTIRDTGASKSFPAAPDNFAPTVWPLLTTNCAGCHTESLPTAQAPFFAESDVDAAYAAVVSSQKINLDDPAISRLVVRLDPEFHNCWATPTGADPTGCIASGQLMLDAIIAFANDIPLTQVDPAWVTSKALDLTDGILASGGARDDSSTIALYEMKTGTGTTIYDTSGVEPALNLSLSGSEGIDFNWVGGWGIEFMSGLAQGSAQNTKLRDHIVSSGAYSIEAWVVPANVNQGTAGDPARIITYSASTAAVDRNFTLGQAEYRYEYMNRNPNDPTFQNSLITDDTDEDLQASQQHVVATYDPINGRKIYVNGVDVSTIGNDTGSTDPVLPGSLTDWDDSFAFILGSEAGGNDPWAGKLRLVAIHNRALSQAQITQNLDAGVGEKFYLMFSVSDLIDDYPYDPTDPNVPPVDTNCFQTSARTTSNPRGDQCFIYMLVSQFDSYSYLFNAPTFISLNPGFTPTNTPISGMRIGLNGKEPAVGQAYINVGKPTPVTINATDYVPANGGQVISSIGTIIALEKGAGADKFFLSFEQFGTNTDVRTPFVCNPITDCMATPVDGTPVSDIGLRTFDEINATMAVLTGVDPNLPQFVDVKETFYKKDPITDIVTGIKQQLPSVETIEGFVSANQMAIAQLAIQYCDALVDDGTLRDTFFGAGFGFTSDVDTAFAGGGKNQIVDALYDNMVAYRALGNTTKTLANVPDIIDVRAELIGPDPVVTGYPGNLYDRLYTTANCSNVPCDQVRTRAVVKALCTSVLGSAAMLIQ